MPTQNSLHQSLLASVMGITYRVSLDGKEISTHKKLTQAKTALRQLKLTNNCNGYLDEITDEGDESKDQVRPLYQKLKTSGMLLECF